MVRTSFPATCPVSPAWWALAAWARGEGAGGDWAELPVGYQVADRGHSAVVGFDEKQLGPDAALCRLGGHLGTKSHYGYHHAALAERAQRPGRVVPAHGVQHDVGTIDRRGEVGVVAVDQLIGTQATDEVVVARAGRADHVGTPCL